MDLVAFKAHIKRANPTFERFVKSDLRPLIDLLENNNSTVPQVRAALMALRPEKVAKYRDAIWYLQATYPGLRDVTPNVGPYEKTRAARYTRTALPPNYNPNGRPPVRNAPPSAWLPGCVEEWLLRDFGTKGILLVHLSDFQPPMNDVFKGRRVVDHMNSVLRIGRLTGCNLLCLYMAGNPVCAELADAANAYGRGRKTDLHVHPGHMGGVSQVYRDFAAQHANVIVMGFDANVCVNANLFGSPERMPALAGGGFVPPLTSLTNAITSRAVLVTAGQIYPFGNNGEYGVLNLQ